MGKKDILEENSIYKKMESPGGISALFEFATEGILVTDSKGRIVKINPAALKLFGYEQEHLLGEPIEKLIPQRFANKHVENRNQFIQSPHPRSMGKGIDLFGLCRDGKEIPVEISLSPYLQENEQFVIAFIVDITERKENEKKLKNYSQELELQVEQRTLILSEAINELEKTKEDLKEALEQEKELGDLKSRFVSMVSHEFRTPLATILSSLALVRKYVEMNEREKQDKHFDRIKTSVNNLTDMLNDVLSLSKLEEGKVVVNNEMVILSDFIEDILQELRTIAKHDQKIEFVYEHKLAQLPIDKKIIRHILFNLISNAIKFSPEDGLIKIQSKITDEKLFIEVKDNGIGISAEDQKHLFESFFRGGNAINIPGTGLGLNIIYRYIKLLHGEITIYSQLNQGTTFIIELPINHQT